MPYRIERSKSCPADHPYAVILEATGEKVACHRTRKGAQAQIAAIYAAEAGRKETRKEQPTSTDVHVPTVMGGNRRRRRRKPATTPDVLLKGDYVGHPFRGNQWSTAEGQSRGTAGSSGAPLGDVILTGQREYRVVPETVYGGGTRYVKTLFVDGRQTSWHNAVLHQTPEQAEKAMGKFRKETEAILTSDSVRAEVDAQGQTTVSWDEGRAGFGRTTKRVDFVDDEGAGAPLADASDALAAYTKDSLRINNALRSGKITEGPLDSLMESGPAETLHRTIANDRGTADRLAAELRAGNDIVDKGYSSTSRDRTTAQDMDPMGDGLLLEVRVPQGSPRLPVPAGTYISDQEEVILPHGTRFRPVGEFRDDDGRVGFVVDVVGTVAKGDFVGHPFRGNQWTTAEGQASGDQGAADQPARTTVPFTEALDILYSSSSVQEAIQRLNDRLGKGGPPAVRDLAPEEITGWRAVTTKGAARLVRGELAPRVDPNFGQGLYYIDARYPNARQSVAGYGGHVVGLRLDDDARMLPNHDAWYEARGITGDIETMPDGSLRTTAGSPIDSSRLPAGTTFSDLFNFYWASQGYDGFRASPWHDTVLFNHAILTVDRAALRDITVDGEPVVKGDYVGHPFRGNQWTNAEGQSRSGAGAGAPDPAKDEQAWRMRQEGRSWEDIARELGYANGGSVRRLAMRHEARMQETGGTTPPVPEVIEPAPAQSASGYRNGMKEPTDDLRTALLEGRPIRALVDLPAPILAAEASFKARHEGYLDAKQRADAAYEAQFPPPIAFKDRFKSGTTPEQRAEWDRWDRGREAWLQANRPELIEAREQAARARDEALIVAGEMHADLAWRAFGFTPREADDTTLTVAQGERLRRDPEGKLKRYDDRERLTSVPAAARMAVSSGGKESLQSRWSREAETSEDDPKVKHANWSAKDLLAAGFTEQQIFDMAAAANGWQNERIRMVLSDEHHTADTTDDIRRGRAVRQERQDHLVKAIGEKPLVSITIPASKVKSVMESGRYKTQFETGKSGGYNVPQVRAEWESYLFGYPPYMDPTMRPVSGMVETGGLRTPATRGNEQYGDAVIVLKPSVRERTTVTDGDSLRLVGTAGSLSNPNATTWASYGKTVLQPPERTYLEAQVHGGVPTSDMQMVIFTGGAPSAAVQKALKTAGVPWHVATTDADMAALEASVVQKRRILPTLLIKGDYVGHPFRGNQWTTSEGQSRGGASGAAASDPSKDEQAWQMRQAGKSWEKIAEELGYANGGSVRRLAMRHEARLKEQGTDPSVVKPVEPTPPAPPAVTSAPTAGRFTGGVPTPTDDLKTALLEGRPMKALTGEMPAEVKAAERGVFDVRVKMELNDRAMSDTYAAAVPPPLASVKALDDIKQRQKDGTLNWDDAKKESAPHEDAVKAWSEGRDAWIAANRPDLKERQASLATALQDEWAILGEAYLGHAMRGLGFVPFVPNPSDQWQERTGPDQQSFTWTRFSRDEAGPSGRLKKELTTGTIPRFGYPMSDSKKAPWYDPAREGKGQGRGPQWSARALLEAGFTEDQIGLLTETATSWMRDRYRFAVEANTAMMPVRTVWDPEVHIQRAVPSRRVPIPTVSDMEAGVRREQQRIVDEWVGTEPVVSITVPSRVLGSILSDGRYKSQFETARSGGYNLPRARAEWEAHMFGYPPHMDPAQRPVYGMVETGGIKSPKTRGNEQYGDAMIILRPETRQRTTFTDGDSLNLTSLHAPLSDPMARPILKPNHAYSSGPIVDSSEMVAGGRYLEAQIHGQVKTSDIQMVIFTGKPPSAAAQKALAKAGIKWEHATTDAEIAEIDVALVQKRWMRMTVVVKGDFVGHPFRGNQWSNAEGQGRLGASSRSDDVAADLAKYPPTDAALVDALAAGRTKLGGTMADELAGWYEAESLDDLDGETSMAMLTLYQGSGFMFINDELRGLSGGMRRSPAVAPRSPDEIADDPILTADMHAPLAFEKLGLLADLRRAPKGSQEHADITAKIEANDRRMRELGTPAGLVTVAEQVESGQTWRGPRNQTLTVTLAPKNAQTKDLPIETVVVETVRALDKLSQPAPRNMRVYRGIDADAIAGLEASVGKVVSDAGIGSASLNLGVAYAFAGTDTPSDTKIKALASDPNPRAAVPAGQRVVTVLIPKGFPIVLPQHWAVKHEEEVLLRPALRMRVVGVDENGPVLEVVK